MFGKKKHTMKKYIVNVKLYIYADETTLTLLDSELYHIYGIRDYEIVSVVEEKENDVRVVRTTHSAHT